MYKYLRISLEDLVLKLLLSAVFLAVITQIAFVVLDISGYEKVAQSVNSWFTHKFDGNFQAATESQEKTIFVNPVVNSVKIGPMTGNKNLSFGVKNIIEEVVQDKGYSLTDKESAYLLINTNIVYMDQQQTSSNVSIFHKDENKVIIRMEGQLVNKDGKVVKKQLVTDESSEISTSTLLVSESGQFNSTVMRNAIKKTCILLVDKLLG